MVKWQKKSAATVVWTSSWIAVWYIVCFHGLLMIFRNTLQGLGYSVLAIVSGVGELIGRSLGGVLAVKTSLGYLGICLSNPFAWGLAMFYCLFMVCRILRRETQTEA